MNRAGSGRSLVGPQAAIGVWPGPGRAVKSRPQATGGDMPGADKPSEAILEPDLPIIDPHHHLWDRPAALMASLPPPKHGFEHVMRRVPRYLLDELLADMNRGHKVVATVYMECGSMYRAGAAAALRPVGETEFVAGVAAMSASG